MNDKYTEIENHIPYYDTSRFARLDDLWRGLVGWNNYYRLLWAAVSVRKPKHVVEIGRERGVSAVVMLDALPHDSILTSIDINPEAVFLDNWNEPRLKLITSDSLLCADKVTPMDFLFIDGDHTYETVSKEWELYGPKVTDGGIVFFDDIHFNEGMTRFWNELEGEKYDISQWHEPGFGVLFK